MVRGHKAIFSRTECTVSPIGAKPATTGASIAPITSMPEAKLLITRAQQWKRHRPSVESKVSHHRRSQVKPQEEKAEKQDGINGELNTAQVEWIAHVAQVVGKGPDGARHQQCDKSVARLSSPALPVTTQRKPSRSRALATRMMLGEV
jgi:hypothetical protein